MYNNIVNATSPDTYWEENYNTTSYDQFCEKGTYRKSVNCYNYFKRNNKNLITDIMQTPTNWPTIDLYYQ